MNQMEESFQKVVKMLQAASLQGIYPYTEVNKKPDRTSYA